MYNTIIKINKVYFIENMDILSNKYVFPIDMIMA